MADDNDRDAFMYKQAAVCAGGSPSWRRELPVLVVCTN